ncbi:MAG: DUF3616 domain-containing protein [Pseudomonadota bacterium]
MPSFQPLTGIYEPSAVQQLPDGRFLVVEDEKQHPLSLISIGSDGHIDSRPVERDADDVLGKLDDLEGLTLDAAGNIYAITSHSRTGDGDEKKSRNKLVRFRIEGDRIVTPAVATDLKSRLIAAHPVLATAAEVLDVKSDGGLNIEALDIAPDTQQLLIGLRSPLLDGKAIIARVDNPAAMFDAGEVPRVAPALDTLDTLDLGGDGIRGLSWIPALQGYLIISGPMAREQVQFRLRFWNGHHDGAARPVVVPGLPGFEHAEGVTPALIDGQQRIIIVSDDGDREEGRYARYLLLDPAQLQIA